MSNERAITRNADGSRNLTDLRKALAANSSVSVHKQGGQWVIRRWSDSFSAWVEQPCHYSADERAAIEQALDLTPDE